MCAALATGLPSAPGPAETTETIPGGWRSSTRIGISNPPMFSGGTCGGGSRPRRESCDDARAIDSAAFSIPLSVSL
jgi:hypothetical protein